MAPSEYLAGAGPLELPHPHCRLQASVGDVTAHLCSHFSSGPGARASAWGPALPPVSLIPASTSGHWAKPILNQEPGAAALPWSALWPPCLGEKLTLDPPPTALPHSSPFPNSLPALHSSQH